MDGDSIHEEAAPGEDSTQTRECLGESGENLGE
jgi:hypothetical protein